MKTKIILSICLLFSFCSCDEWLDVQPKTMVKENKMFENEEGFKQALMGIYLTMSSKPLYGQEASFYFLDFASNIYENTATSNAKNSYFYVIDHNYTEKSTRSFVDGIWSTSYNCIANINNLLIQLEKTNVLDPITKAVIQGEALGLRAFLHLDLLRMFGPGNLAVDKAALNTPVLPYVRTYDKYIEKQLTVKELLVEIHKDLDQAITLLDKNDPWGSNLPSNYKIPGEDNCLEPIIDGYDGYIKGSRKVRLNYFAALAIKARAYMWEGNYVDALPLLEKIIPTEEIKFAEYTDADKFGFDEFVFGLNVYNIYNDSQINNYFGTFSGQGDDEYLMYLSEELHDEIYEMTELQSDSRGLILWKLHNGKMQFTKYNNKDLAPEKHYVPLIRKPEIMYMAAECINRIGEERAKAIQYLNKVRDARGIVIMLAEDLNETQIDAEIQKEYYKDFYGEGQIFFYLKRKEITNLPYFNKEVSKEIYVLPIPDAETSAR